MIKTDIINQVAKAADITRVKAVVAVEAVLDSMKESMRLGERIELRGFGVFQVKPRKKGGESFVVPLTHGSLLVMEAPMQTAYLHSVPKTKKPTGPRINLTFRYCAPAS